MNKQLEKIKSRREMFKSALRYATLGILGVFAGNIFVKKQKLARKGICINREICHSCRIFNECDLPAALYANANVNENR